MGTEKPAFKAGDRVRVRPGIANPTYGWAGVAPRSIGTVESVAPSGKDMTVKFPRYGSGWHAVSSEMELAPAIEAKAPTKLKAPAKPVWSRKFCYIHPKSTKAALVKLLRETVDQLNETGTKLVAAQNTIATLRKKAAK